MADTGTQTTATRGAGVATLALTVACMAWGVSFVFLKDLDHLLEVEVGGPAWIAPLWIVAARFLVAGLLLLPVVVRGLARPVLTDALLLAVPSILGYVLQAGGMRGLDAGTNAFLTSLYTPLTPLLAWALLRHTPAPRVLVAVVVATGGAALLSVGERALPGVAGAAPPAASIAWYPAHVVAGSVCWALQILGIDRWARRHPPGAFSCALFLWIGAGGALSIAVALAPGALGHDPAQAGLVGRMARVLVHPDVVRPLGGLVLLSTILALTLINRFQPRLDPSRAALLYTLEPAFAGAFALVLHGERFGGLKLGGCGVLLLANLIVEAPGLLALLRPAPAVDVPAGPPARAVLGAGA